MTKHVVKKTSHRYAMTRFCELCGERIRRERLQFRDLFARWKCPCCKGSVEGVGKTRGVK